MIDAATAVDALVRGAGLAGNVALDLTGAEPVLPSSFAVGTAAQASIAAVAVGAAEIDRLRNGRRQSVAVDMRHAAAEFRSERYLRLDGEPLQIWDNLSGAYRAGDGRWLRLHMLLPHHNQGVISLLGCDPDRQSIAEALLDWKAADFEAAAAERGLVVAMMRSLAEWDASAEGRAVAEMPPLAVEQIGEAPAQPMPPSERPLGGIRVLDLTRIIAGPVCGRVLAAHGADVLHITSPNLPFALPFVIDSGRGKLSAHLDLETQAGRDRLRELVAGADVVLQSYRPGALAGKGFGPQDLASIRPGIVCLSLSAYSWTGPWHARRGFDSLVQTASGLNHAEAEARGQAEPLPLPCQVLDHASGYLLALGAMAGLQRRASIGGSWHARVSLAATGHWFRGLGRLADGMSCADMSFADVSDLLYDAPSGFGELTAMTHAGRLSETPPQWSRPSVPLGTHAPQWVGAA